MKHVKRLLSFCLFILCGMPLWSQQLMITKEFEEVQFSNVLALYKNEFGKHEKPALDDTFPYALFQVQLEGNASEVKKAKELLRFYLGRMTAVQDVYLDNPNEMLFLIPSRARYIYMTCGDGCEQQTVMENARLKSNKIYRGVYTIYQRRICNRWRIRSSANKSSPLRCILLMRKWKSCAMVRKPPLH